MPARTRSGSSSIVLADPTVAAVLARAPALGVRRLVAHRRRAVPDGVELADRAAGGHRDPGRRPLLLRRRHLVGGRGRRHPGRGGAVRRPAGAGRDPQRGAGAPLVRRPLRHARAAPFRDCADAIDSFAAVCCCYGVTARRRTARRGCTPRTATTTCSPWWSGPTRGWRRAHVYEAKAARWQQQWPELTVLPWDADPA